MSTSTLMDSRKKDPRKIIDCLFAMSFLLFLLLSFSFVFLRNQTGYSYYENRNLARLPDMTIEGMLDGSDFSAVETCLADHAPGRDTALKLRTLMDLYLWRRPVVNDTVVLRDEHILLPYTQYEYEASSTNQNMIDSKAEAMANTLSSHKALTESYGGYFCYMAVPCQYVCYEDAYPSYLNSRHTFTERSTTALFSRLDAMDVPYIDMRTVYNADGTLKKYSSTIDNHYSIQGAFSAYQALIEKINKDTDLSLDMPTAEDHVWEEIPNKYLGSRLRKLCGLWESDEHLWKVTPKDQIPYTFRIGEYVVDSMYTLPSDPWQEILYTAYMCGDLSESVVETERENLPRVLIYGDSFTNALECVLWESFDDMYSYDFRHYNSETVEEVIARLKPDVVVCVRDYEQLLSGAANGQ